MFAHCINDRAKSIGLYAFSKGEQATNVVNTVLRKSARAKSAVLSAKSCCEKASLLYSTPENASGRFLYRRPKVVPEVKPRIPGSATPHSRKQKL